MSRWKCNSRSGKKQQTAKKVLASLHRSFNESREPVYVGISLPKHGELIRHRCGFRELQLKDFFFLIHEGDAQAPLVVYYRRQLSSRHVKIQLIVNCKIS